MFFRSLRKSPPRPSDDAAWWQDASDAEQAPLPDTLAALRARMAAPDVAPDEAERQGEMLDALARLAVAISQVALPVISTQHRVIGHAVCHFVAPASLRGQTDAPGKLFVTSDALVFAGGRVLTWPWHRVRGIVRDERTLVVTIAGGGEPTEIQCNTYGDAVIARHLAGRLRHA